MQSAKVLFALMLMGIVLACKPVTLDPNSTVPPQFQYFQIFDVPSYVGSKPTVYDGTWEGFAIMDFSAWCTYNVDTVFQVIYEIKNGVFKKIHGHYDYYFMLDAGYVNDVGTFILVSSGDERAKETWSGTITGDRMRGTWREWTYGCSGRIELARIIENRHYCLNFLDNSTYVHSGSCRGMDRTLTKAEFEEVSAMPAEKIRHVETPVSAQDTIEAHLEILRRHGR